MNQNISQDERKQIGEAFRIRRTELSLSLKEIENATSIRINYLQAIEDGQIHKFLSPIYVIGFIKQYASYINIDGEKLLHEYPNAFGHLENQEFDYGIGTLEVRNTPGSGVKGLPNVLWIIAFLGVIALAWWLARYLELI
ncbi:MAG: hypothetical protein K0S74_1434 [Chlamydiales bacterium]|jgi:cytoskeletal protein RodZ|nr:hypothetical protein [Chlamydiales bacterium]